ncbi:MAG: hypothetical protein PHF11_02545 [Candidatus Omnitrophica bacterium]|nr:hypothetical protein [Candidatus Omnitrophota bacterium]
MMTRDNNKLRGILSIFIFCFLSAGYAFAAGPANQDGSNEQKQAKAGILTLPRVEYKSEGLRDPFEGVFHTETAAASGTYMQLTQAAPAQVPPPSLSVQGIIWGGKMPLAIIDNKVVKVGDTVSDAKIVSIGKSGIEVIFKNYIFTLPSPAAEQLQDLKESLKGGQDEN